MIPRNMPVLVDLSMEEMEAQPNNAPPEGAREGGGHRHAISCACASIALHLLLNHKKSLEVSTTNPSFEMNYHLMGNLHLNVFHFILGVKVW